MNDKQLRAIESAQSAINDAEFAGKMLRQELEKLEKAFTPAHEEEDGALDWLERTYA